jgi:hypothetical protein
MFSFFPSACAYLAKVKAQHEQDLEDGFGELHLPHALECKYKGSTRSWPWQFVFPSARISADLRTGARRRHHVDENVLQVAVSTNPSRTRARETRDAT